jgi:hypothetical protein
MNTKAKGDVCEIKVAAALIEVGYSVSIPWGDNQRYDMLIDDGEQIYKVQCKHARYRDGCVVFNTVSCGTGKYSKQRSYEGQIDYFGVYSPDTKLVYLVPIEDATNSSMLLRVELPKKPMNTINWAKDYIVGA